MSANDGLYEDFYARIGLDLSQLEAGLANADRTIEQNIRRLNQESNLIRLRSEVEIAGLDEAADAEQILQVRTNALNQQMAIQRDRIRLMEAELQNLTSTYGANATATQQATIRLERQRLVLANMERELRNLTSPQNNEGLVRFNAVLQNFGDGLDGFLRADITGLLEKIPPQFKAVAAGIGAVATGAEKARGSVEALLEDFRELQTQAYELNMSVGKTRDFLRQLRLGGGDIGDFEGYIRGITDAFVKGEYDDPEFIALRKYGAVITDETGRLKEFKELADEVYQAFKKADEAGEGIEFLQLTGGESGIRDAIQFFRRYEEAVADAQKIFKSNINETQLQELDRVMKLVEEQATELKDALGDIFVPAAQTAAEKFFQTLHDGTEWLVENKDAIQKWGFIAEEVFSTIADKVKEGYHTVGEFIEEALKPKNTAGNEKVDKMMSGLDWRYGGAMKTPYGVDAMISGQVKETGKSFKVMDGIVERAKQKQAEYNEELKKTAEQIAATEKELDRNPLNQYALQRVQQFKDELAELRIDLDYESEYEKEKARLDLWFDQEFTRKNYLSEAEKSAIRELYDVKLDKINADYQAELEAAAEKVKEHLQNVADIEYEMTHTAFEKQIRDIEQWRDAKIEAGEDAAAVIAESAAKEAQAFEREVDRIKDLTQSFEDEIFEMENSQYDADKRRALQKAQKALDDGVDFSVVQRYLQDKVGQIDKRAKESRENGGDYTKSPTGMSWNGLPVLQQITSLMTNENQIRERLINTLDEEAKAEAERINSLRDKAEMSLPATPAMVSGAIGDTTIIHGDEITQISLSDLKAEMEKIQSATPTMQTEPLTDINETVQSVLTAVQSNSVMDKLDSLQELLSELPNIKETVQSVLQSAKTIATNQGTQISFKPLEIPLNQIVDVVEKIPVSSTRITELIEKVVSAINDREPSQVNVSPNLDINLGGAYVFDDAMKKSLVDDITNKIVTAIKDAVQQATRTTTTNYGFGY